MKKRYALLSVFDKTGIEHFAAALIALGFTIISSGGTARYLTERGIAVTPVSEITGYEDVLGHRVVTLAPQLHGGLLATKDMSPELDELKWKWIDLVYVTFYPLADELAREGATFESCLALTDIGGPGMIRSAVKGGNGRIVMVSSDQIEDVLYELSQPELSEQFLRRLRATAERTVADYCVLSAQVHEAFLDA